MFVRKHVVKGVAYLSLVDNIWNPIKKYYVQTRITGLGKASDLVYKNNKAEQIVTAIHAFCTRHGIATLSDGVILSDLSSRQSLLSASLDFGIHKLAVHVLKKLGIADTIRSIPAGARTTREKVLAATESLIAHRLTNRTDASERSTGHWYTHDLFVPGKLPLTKDDWYRTLDVLIAHKDAIEQAYFETNRNLFSQSLDLVLFDTTSIYYWGGGEKVSDAADLLQYGFSKDGKGNLKQLIVGVLMTSSGVPIAHEVFPGNTADVKSFATIIKTVKEKYKLEKVVLVADRGMISEENLLILEEMNLGYIVGVRMRTLPGDLQITLMDGLDPKDMERVHDHLFTKQYHVSNFSPKQIKDWFLDRILKGKRKNPLPTMDIPTIEKHVRNRRFFVFLNPLVEQATKGKRAFFKKIIQSKIAFAATKDWVVKNGYKKYVRFPDGISPELDEEKLSAEELFDGKWVLVTNVKDVIPVEAGRYYQTLQKIERGFRDLKSLITIQPVFHYTQKRIRAHIFVCFLSLVVKWHILRTINPYSQEEGRRFLEDMEKLKAVAVDPTIPLFVRTEITEILRAGMGKLNMQPPQKVIVDGRKEKLIRGKHEGGRPKNDTSNQTTLLDTI